MLQELKNRLSWRRWFLNKTKYTSTLEFVFTIIDIIKFNFTTIPEVVLFMYIMVYIQTTWQCNLYNMGKKSHKNIIMYNTPVYKTEYIDNYIDKSRDYTIQILFDHSHIVTYIIYFEFKKILTTWTKKL